ncbi:hypothetical protein D9M71_777130 [compost metagenome]
MSKLVSPSLVSAACTCSANTDAISNGKAAIRGKRVNERMDGCSDANMDVDS